MSDGMGREPAYLSSHATNRYFIPNWGIVYKTCLLFFRTNPFVLTQIKSKIQQETDLSIILLYFYN